MFVLLQNIRAYFTQSSSLFLITCPYHLSLPLLMTVVIGSTPNNSSLVLLCFMETPHIHLIICCIFVFSKYTHSVCWWRLAISTGGLSSSCQYESNLRKLTRGKPADEAHIYNSHFRLWLSNAFTTWRPSARNTTNGTRSNSTERTSRVASNGIIFLAFELCWSRGPDGIRCFDDLRRHQEFSQ